MNVPAPASTVLRPRILRDIRTATETHGGYQELLSEKGLKYRTWAYQGAVAHSWFPVSCCLEQGIRRYRCVGRELDRLICLSATGGGKELENPHRMSRFAPRANAAAVFSPTSRTSGSAWR
jgi:hypothetical protein